jgi:protocatechuate 3,4-dioxygenase alpha subunit
MSGPLPTASQTVGPFYGLLFLRREPLNVLVGPDTVGQRIRIEGRVIDGDGAPVEDAMVEIWQANAHGRYNHPADTRDLPLDPAFTGFGRSGTEDGGRFWFETIKPGAVPFDGERAQAPHIVVTVFARGMLNHAATRLYFEDEPANETDPILSLVPPERRKTLLAEREPLADKDLYRFDIVLQGDGETVFFRR